MKRVLPIINEDINEEWISDKTRYACDGLLNQRLDTPFIKYNGKFEKASWEEVYKIIKSKIEKAYPSLSKKVKMDSDMIQFLFQMVTKKHLRKWNLN